MAQTLNEKERRVLFARIGWMRFYKGTIPGDDQLLGGGAYNKTKVGSEVSNFADVQGKLYGFVQGIRDSGVNIARVGGVPPETEHLKNVLVIFVARHPTEGGQRIVGWHRDATVFRWHQSKPRRPFSRYYTSICKVDTGVLLPTSFRRHSVPSGNGAFGQSNVCYPLASDGTSKWRTWMSAALDYVKTYAGPNLLDNPNAEADQDVSNAVERSLSQSQGQGFGGTAEERLAIDTHAMKRAERYFRHATWDVENVSDKQPYDLKCTKGQRELHVEVKGTTTAGEKIVLTRGEVRWKAGGAKRALFILHSILLSKAKASGGKEWVNLSWKIDYKKLTPVSYIYQVNL